MFSFFKRTKLHELPLWKRGELEARLLRAWPRLPPHALRLHDGVYRAVTLADIERACHTAAYPWKLNSWDCNAQASALVHYVRVYRRTREPVEAAPACGSIHGINPQGIMHAFVWFRAPSGAVLFYDPSERREVVASNIKNPNFLTDK
jgi:hypothetical protein